MLLHMGASLLRVLVAMGVSLVVGTVLGLLCGVFRGADVVLRPILYVLYPIPKIAFLPLLMVTMGLGDAPKVVLICIIIVFQFILSVRQAVLDIPPVLRLSVQSLCLKPSALLWHFYLPAVRPAIFTSVRMNLGISFSVLFFAESFATKYGIGYYIMNNWVMANYQAMVSGIAVLSICGILMFLIVDFLERKIGS